MYLQMYGWAVQMRKFRIIAVMKMEITGRWQQRGVICGCRGFLHLCSHWALISNELPKSRPRAVQDPRTLTPALRTRQQKPIVVDDLDCCRVIKQVS